MSAFERRRLVVYVAGPISTGDTFENIHNGIRWGRQLWYDGLAPIIPHFDAYMTLSPSQEHTSDGPTDLWRSLLEWDLELVAKSDAMFRIAGPSKGAELEARIAWELEVPIFAEDPSQHRNYGQGYLVRGNYADLLSLAELRGLRGLRQAVPT